MEIYDELFSTITERGKKLNLSPRDISFFLWSSRGCGIGKKKYLWGRSENPFFI
jgi:hypothetical protein